MSKVEVNNSINLLQNLILKMMSSDDADYVKPTITKTEWVDRLNQSKFAKRDMNKLIMNFFLIEGYRDAAENFKKESGTDISNMDLTFMQERLDIRSMIHDGEIDNAISKVKDLNPKILEENQNLHFTLILQKLIELIKVNKILESLEYAQKELNPFVEKNPKFLDQVEKVMTLLAFEDVSTSKVADLVENSQKIKVASEVNHELLRSQSKDTDSKISTLMKMLLWSQARLKEKVNFPTISNLATSEFSNEA